MKTFKKIVSTALVLALLAGCAGNGGTVSTSPSGGTENTTSAGSEKKDKGTLKIHYHGNDKYTLNDNEGKLKPVYALASEKTGIGVVSVANPAAQKSKDEFQLQAAEKFPADIYGGTSLKTPLYSYAEQGAFIPLNDLIETNAPNIKAYLDEHPEVRKAITADNGNIYMIPYVPDGKVARTWFIRQDWLDTLGLQTPTTVEELEAVLYAFKDNDPNGNGKKDEIPLFNDKFEEMIRTANLWGARVYGYDSFAERIALDENDQFYHAWIDDDFKVALTKMSQWYADGIIDPEVFTRKANTARATLLTKENTGGMTHEWLASTASYNSNSEMLASVPDFKFTAILPFSYNGVTGFEEHQRIVAKPEGWGISANSKIPESAIEYMDWFFSPEGKIAANFGIEGESYTMVDGKPQFTPEVLATGTVNQYLWDNYGAQYPIGYPQDYEYERQWTNEEGQKAYDLYLNNATFAKVTPVLNFNAEEIKVQDKYLAVLNTYLDEMAQGFITNKYNVETDWDSYVAKVKELGSQELVEIYESAYERYKAS